MNGISGRGWVGSCCVAFTWCTAVHKQALQLATGKVDLPCNRFICYQIIPWTANPALNECMTDNTIKRGIRYVQVSCDNALPNPEKQSPKRDVHQVTTGKKQLAITAAYSRVPGIKHKPGGTTVCPRLLQEGAVRKLSTGYLTCNPLPNKREPQR